MSENEQRMALIAKRYYIDERTQIEIAQELGISRFSVARLLEQAKALGIIRFEIRSPTGIDFELSAQLRAAYGLRHAVVVHPTSGSETDLRQRLGVAAARLLAEVLLPGEVLGLAAGRTIQAMVSALDTLPVVDVLQLEGVASGVQESAFGLVQHAARVSGGVPYALLAPLLTSSEEACTLLRAEPSIRATLDRFPEVTTAIVGVGSWDPEDSQFAQLADQFGFKKELLAAGVCTDVGALLLDADGRELDILSRRRISIDSATLRTVPHVLAVSGGLRKLAAITAGLRSGLIHSLVCDAAVATKLVEAPRHNPHTLTAHA